MLHLFSFYPYALPVGSLMFLVWLSLGFLGAPLWLWTLFVLINLVGWGSPCWLLILFGGLAVVSNVPLLRRALVSSVLMKVITALGLIPKVSDTEQAALDAGQVWIEGDFFRGRPDFAKLMKESYPELSREERDYIEGPIDQLCAMLDEWKIFQDREIPQKVWDFMKKIKIFGMIIPKEYGGLDFSALAHSEVIMKLASRSLPVTITAMVPNSLGPAELLKHYGTKEQKDFYLPRLASGEEIPCFALTEPRAGSDAGSIESEGVIFKKKDELYLRLNWNKRWITLSGVSNVLGLAFQLLDPEGLLGGEKEVGITCVLIPSNTPGVVLNRRHDPLGTPFVNCPTQGVDVEIPASHIIGGLGNAGKGWTMLMESLSAGRGISLPSQAVGTCKLIARITSDHSSIRKQFGLALCKLEGVEEPLARIGGITYAIEAMRRLTQGALDRGIKPPVVTAIAKFNGTELGRKVVNDGMDIMAGTGITLGPRNLIAHIYQATPIGITVEGANILTRTLIIFGQGLFRAHPWAYQEVDSLKKKDLKKFDHAIWSHCGHFVRNSFRFGLLNLTRGRLASTPGGEMKRYYQKLSWVSATFSLMTDVAMGALGENLKRKEKISGRFADVLSWMYLETAILRRFLAEGSPKEDLPFVHFSLQYGLKEIQDAFDGIFGNLSVPGMTWFLRGVVRPWFRFNAIGSAPGDELGHQVAHTLVSPGPARDRLCQGIYFPKVATESLARLEHAFHLIKEVEPLEKRITQAIHAHKLPKDRIYQLIDPALEKGIINESEATLLKEAALARWDACQVDDFSDEGYHGVEESNTKMFRPSYRGPAGPPN